MSQLTYAPLSREHFAEVVALGNAVHGDKYLTLACLEDIYQRSINYGIKGSFVALDQQKVVGFRLTLSANKWQPDQWCSPELWNTTPQVTCYFKCNTVNADYRGSGIGSQLLTLSVEQAKLQGAKAGIAHIWMSSPGNSAFKYFSKCGGKLVKEHPRKWDESHLEDGYECPVCGKHCFCIASEMILYFS